MDVRQYADLFLSESRDHLTAYNHLLLEWEKDPAQREAVGGIFRAVHTIKGMAAQVFESGGIKEEATTVGAAGAVGAIVGGIIGGLKGALIGAAVGAGGVIAATEGKDVVLPGGTLVRVRLDPPVRIP